MNRPALKNDDFLAQVREFSVLRDGRLHVWWLGQSGFLIQWQGQHLLLDPYLSDSLTEKYAATNKPHIRMTERVIAPECLDFIDVVTSSHKHTDHFDLATLGPLMRINGGLKLVLPNANLRFAEGCLGQAETSRRLVGLDDGATAKVGAWELHGIPAAHNTIERDEAGHCKCMGFVIRVGNWTIYHSGDTIWYEGMVDRLREFNIDLALLPINGDRPERQVAGNMDGGDAARLASAIGARMVIPCHYDMFAFNTADPSEFRKECERLGQACRILRNGESWLSPEIMD